MQVPIYSRINAPMLPLKDLEAALLDNLDEDMIKTLSAEHGELSVKVKPEYLLEMARILRDTPTLDFQQLIDITAVDHPERKPRFEVVYHLLSIGLNQRLRIKVLTDEADPVSSVITVWPNANWYEREIWDMFGVSFQNHPDLRRLLTDYGFDGHPLRKDFPVTGRVEMRYDNQKGRIVQEAVNLKQAFRNFETISPWKGLNFKAKQNPEEQEQTEQNPEEQEQAQEQTKEQTKKQDKGGLSNG